MINRTNILANQLLGRYHIGTERAVADADEILEALDLPDLEDADPAPTNGHLIRLEVVRVLLRERHFESIEDLLADALKVAEAIETGHAPAKESGKASPAGIRTGSSGSSASR